jgi:hypothetical protein
VPTGAHQVALGGVAQNCAVTDATFRSVTIHAGETADVAFAVSCHAPTGTVEVTVTTSGVDFDSDGYTIAVDGAGLGGPLWCPEPLVRHFRHESPDMTRNEKGSAFAVVRLPNC